MMTPTDRLFAQVVKRGYETEVPIDETDAERLALKAHIVGLLLDLDSAEKALAKLPEFVPN